MSSSASSRRIAVITAPNLGYANAGMLTVDLAFESIRKQLGPNVDVQWLTLHDPSVLRIRAFVTPEHLPFRLQQLDDLSTVRDSDLVVFWGDFLHTRHYIEQDATINLLEYEQGMDRAAARDRLHRLLLLRDEPDSLLRRTVLYGGTILHNRQSDYLDADYGRAFSRLVAGCHSAWLRDPISVAKAGHFRDLDHQPQFGADAALLLDADDTTGLERNGWADEIEPGMAAGVFIAGRTDIPRWLPGFCKELAARLEVELEWLPWSDVHPAFEARFGNRWGQAMIGDLLAALPRYRFVITDTYHLCVNAWRVGTPAVCIGSPQPGPSQGGILTLNDWKKHLFYSAYEATDLYLSTSVDADELRRDQLDGITRLIAGDGLKPVAARIHQHAQQSEEALVRTLNNIIEHGSS